MIRTLWLLWMTSCALVNSYPDNWVEEEVEEVIEDETGIKIDFTGKTPEAFIPFNMFQF